MRPRPWKGRQTTRINSSSASIASFLVTVPEHRLLLREEREELAVLRGERMGGMEGMGGMGGEQPCVWCKEAGVEV